MVNNEQFQSIASEFYWDEEKLIKKIISEWSPNFKASEEFKNKLDNKLKDKIMFTQQKRQKQAELDAVPKKLKWRFYLTWYGYAVVSFLVLFLIWFCTNIFTWTLKVPTKYNYLEESQARWNFDRWWNLVYNYDLNMASNFSYDGGDISYDDYADQTEYEREDEEDEEAVSEASMVSMNPLTKMVNSQSLWATMTTTESFVKGVWINDYLLADSFTYNQTYRFVYKDKLFPKLSSEYPVYKSSWVLMWSNTVNQVLKSLKIWNVSFKNFQDLDITTLEMEQSVENWYSIFFDNRIMKLSFYPNSSWKASEYTGKIPSKKEIIKWVEGDLKNLWISLKNYWDVVVDLEDFDDSMWIVQIFYPFLIQWRTVRDAEANQQIWMYISYDLNLLKIVSVIWIDVATYDVSNYPVLDKKLIESNIEQWWEYYNQWALHESSTVILINWMDIVYTQKNLVDWSVLYVPTIRSTISTSLEDYVGPTVVYQEII